MSPEPASIPVEVCGLRLEATLPAGMVPVEALVIIRTLAPEDSDHYPDQLWWSSTSGLPSWEAVGMCDFAMTCLREDWKESMHRNGEAP